MNRRESVVFNRAVEDGWEVLTRGWPDFLLYKQKTNEAMFIEVKAVSTRYEKKHDRPMGGIPTKSQKKMHSVLRNLGLTVKVVNIK